MAHSSRLIHPYETQLALAGVRLRARTGCVSDLPTAASQSLLPSVPGSRELTRKLGSGTDATRKMLGKRKRTVGCQSWRSSGREPFMEDSPLDLGSSL